MAGKSGSPKRNGNGKFDHDRIKQVSRWDICPSPENDLIYKPAEPSDPTIIAHSLARSMRDDFDVADIHAVKVALTAEQVRAHNLPPIMRAKKTSSRHDKFVAKHGHDGFELEALEPAELQRILREAIESVIDRAALSAEIEAEKADATFLAGIRRSFRNCLIESLPDLELDESEGDDE